MAPKSGWFDRSRVEGHKLKASPPGDLPLPEDCDCARAFAPYDGVKGFAHLVSHPLGVVRIFERDEVRAFAQLK